MIKFNLQPGYIQMIRQQNAKFMLFASIVFLLMPIAGVFFAVLIIMQNKIKDKRTYFFFFLLMALYMGAINATKTPASDQVNYMHAYMLIPNQTFFESLTNIYGDRFSATSKEVGFGLLNFLGYYLSFGNYKLFILEFSVLLYILMMVSLYKFYRYLNVTPFKDYIISSVFILCFFSQYFNLTIHVQRQMIATAVMLWLLVDSTIKQKVNWIIALIAVSLHTSVALFFPFLILVYFRNKIKVWQILCLIILFCVAIGFLPVASSAFSTLFGGEIYGLNRLANAGSSNETRFDIGIMLFFSIPLTYISLRELWKEKKNINITLNIVFISYIFLICFSFFNPDNTMQYRYFMMSYSFMAFILPLLFVKCKRFNKLYLLFIASFFFVRFYMTFEDMVWIYAPVEDVLLSNYISLLLY